MGGVKNVLASKSLESSLECFKNFMFLEVLVFVSVKCQGLHLLLFLVFLHQEVQ